MRTGLGVLPRFCRLSTVSLLVVLLLAPVALISFAFLLPANAQYWGDPWGGRQQQRQQQYNPFGGFWGDRPGGFLGRPPKGSPAISASERTGERAGTRAAPRLLARTARDAAQGRHGHRSHGRCERGLARLRA